jgi:hypothetical protein
MAPAGAIIRLLRPDGSQPMSATAGRRGEVIFSNLAEGPYILSASLRGFRETVKAVQVQGATTVEFTLPPTRPTERFFTPILTVCEALDQRDSLTSQLVVIVGVFKSGMDETLRLDCPTQLVSGEVDWPSSIGLTNVAPPSEIFRDPVEKKRQEILATALPEAPPRPERVVGFEGRFVSLAGLSSAKCCSAAAETSLPPARLFGVNERDLRVIR